MVCATRHACLCDMLPCSRCMACVRVCEGGGMVHGCVWLDHCMCVCVFCVVLFLFPARFVCISVCILCVLRVFCVCSLHFVCSFVCLLCVFCLFCARFVHIFGVFCVWVLFLDDFLRFCLRFLRGLCVFLWVFFLISINFARTFYVFSQVFRAFLCVSCVYV